MKTKKSFLWLAFLILATIWILVRHNQQVGYYSVKGLVFGTVYKITYQHDGDLKPEIEAELKRFDQSLSPFNDSSVISRVNRNEELVTDSFFQKCFHRSMEISRETKGAFDITVAKPKSVISRIVCKSWFTASESSMGLLIPMRHKPLEGFFPFTTTSPPISTI